MIRLLLVLVMALLTGRPVPTERRGIVFDVRTAPPV